jgi:hypothetical protein
MQRVRIGLTGLAFVFLAVLLAAIITREPAGEEPITPNLIERRAQGAGQAGQEAPPPKRAEPLAELGVAPGNAESNNVAAAAAQTAEPARR